MGYINPIAKWDLKRNKWDYNIKYEEVGKSYAYVNYSDETENVNYIIFSPGIRVENYEEGNNALNNNLQIDSILKHFEEAEDKYNIKMQLMDKDAPIIEEAKQQAKLVDQLVKDKRTKSVTLIGYSKCGVMNFYVPSFFKNKDSFKKTNIINIATPYKGTIMASNKLIFNKFKSGVQDIIKNKKLTDIISNKFKKFYESTSSNSHMDYDISVPNGVTEDKYDLYDKNFINNVFRKENIRSMKKVKSFTNISTGVDKNTFKRAIKSLNLGNLELYLMEKYILKDKSDGIVPVDSQLEVEKYLDVKSRKISSCTHNVHSDKKCLNDLLSIIDETLDVKVYTKR